MTKAIMSAAAAGADERGCAPADKLVEDLDVLLHVGHLHRLLGVEERERRERCAVFDVLAAGLEKAANEEDLEEGVCILQELEGGTSLDELVCDSVKIGRRDVLKMLEELVSEDCRGETVPVSTLLGRRCDGMWVLTVGFVFGLSLDGTFPSFDTDPLERRLCSS